MAARGSGETPAGAAEVWQVGDLTIDVGQQRITRRGVEIRLPKLSFDLLLALVRRAPNVVSSDELMSAVWPGLVVGPETVVQRVKLLRQALDDSAEEQTYVAALRSRGYRLAAAANRIEPGDAVAPQATVEPAVVADVASVDESASSTPERQPRRTAFIVLAAAILAVVTGAGWLNRRAATTPGEIGQPVAHPQAATDADRTVAVLPFENLSPDASDAFIALSLPEMTLNRLSAVRGLTVMARDSSFRVGSRPAGAGEIGRRLGAGYLVGGSVQRNGEKLRVAARLVDARTGTQLWSERFDGRVADLFGMQDEIADHVAAALESRISGLQLPRPGGPASPNVEAYLAYLRGRTLIGRFTVAEAEAAAAEFSRAIELDPTFAAAHAALYDARMQATGLRHDDLDAARNKNRPLLEKAIALDPSSGAAWFARAMWEDLGVAEREAAFRKAVALEPSNSRGLIAFSEFLDITDGRADGSRIVGSGFDPSSRQARGSGVSTATGDRAMEAGRVLDQALRIDPLSPRAHFRVAMRSFRRDGGNAEAPILSVLEIDPDFYPGLQRLAKYRSIFYAHPSEAIAVIERAVRNDPQNPWAPHTAVAFYLDVNDPAAAANVAATTPVSALTARPLLAQFAGDWRAAGEAAMTKWGFEFGFNESWGSSEALRDYALHTRDFAAPMRLLRERFGLPDKGPVQLTLGNYRAAVQLAHLELERGNSDFAREMLQAVVRHVDADVKTPPVYKRRSRAQALMLLGEPERAMADLAASFREDRDYTQWWYALDRDPVWDNLRGSERFRALAAEVRAYAAGERAAVDELRRDGKIPRRGGAPVAEIDAAPREL